MSQLVTTATDALLETARLIADPWYRVPAGRGEEIADAMEQIHDSLVQLERYLHLEYTFDKGRPADLVAYAKLLEEYREPCEEKLTYLLDRPTLFGNDPYYEAEAWNLTELLNQLNAACAVMLAK